MRSYSETLSLVTLFAEGLKQRFGNHVAKVMLIGSYARGDYREDSDIDVVVLLKESSSDLRDRIYDYWTDFLVEHEFDIALKLLDQTTFHHWKQLKDPFSLSVESEGIAV